MKYNLQGDNNDMPLSLLVLIIETYYTKLFLKIQMEKHIVMNNFIMLGLFCGVKINENLY